MRRRPTDLVRRLRSTFALMLVAGLAGCATTPSPVESVAPASRPVPTGTASVVPQSAPPVAPAPAAPAAPVVPAKPASLVGSEETSTLLDNFTAFVVAVDGQAIRAGRAGWNVPVPLPPGSHRLHVAFNRGVFAAEADLLLTAKPAAAYELKFSSDAEMFGRNSYCEFWIVDSATGEPVTGRVRTALARREGSAQE